MFNNNTVQQRVLFKYFEPQVIFLSDYLSDVRYFKSHFHLLTLVHCPSLSVSVSLSRHQMAVDVLEGLLEEDDEVVQVSDVVMAQLLLFH